MPNLPRESRNVHGVGCEAHAEDHRRLKTQKPGHQPLQLLLDVQVPWRQHLSLTTASLQHSVALRVLICVITLRLFTSFKHSLHLHASRGGHVDLKKRFAGTLLHCVANPTKPFTPAAEVCWILG